MNSQWSTIITQYSLMLIDLLERDEINKQIPIDKKNIAVVAGGDSSEYIVIS